MTGRYLIYTPVQSARNEKRFDSAWRKFAEVCRSLHRDGLEYIVQLNLTHLRPHVLITASGTTKPKPQRQPAKRGLAPSHAGTRATLQGTRVRGVVVPA